MTNCGVQKNLRHALIGSTILGLLLSPASAGEILVVNGSSGTSEPGTTASITEQLSNFQEEAGNTVTISDGVPGDLSGFDQVWDIRFSNTFPLTDDVQDQYLGFLQSGGGMFVMGENAGFPTRNDSVIAFVEKAGGGTVAFVGPASSTQEVIERLRGPNPIPDGNISYAAPGAVDSAGNGEFITFVVDGEGNIVNGSGIAFPTGTLTEAPDGNLTIIFDVNFMQTTAEADSQAFLKNLIQFIEEETGTVASTITVLATLPDSTIRLSRFQQKQIHSAMRLMNEAFSGSGLLGAKRIEYAYLADNGTITPIQVVAEDDGFVMTSGNIMAFASLGGLFGDFDATAQESGLDYSGISATLGGGIEIIDGVTAGVAFSYGYLSGDFDSTPGSLETNRYGVSLFGAGSYMGASLQGEIGYAYNEYDYSRGATSISGSTDGNEANASFLANYDFEVSEFVSPQLEPFPIVASPFGQLNYTGVWISGYTEGGGLAVESQDAHSLETQLGVQLTGTAKASWGHVKPTVGVAYGHEFLDGARTIQLTTGGGGGLTARTDDAGRNYMVANGGVTVATEFGADVGVQFDATLFRKEFSEQRILGTITFEF